MAGLLTGFDAAIISGALVFINHHFSLQNHLFLQEVIVSVVVIGGLVGGLMAKYLTSLTGRRRAILVTTQVFLLGTLIVTTTNNVYFLIMGRFILGIAIGFASMIAPMYLAEISPSRHRGQSVFFYQLSVTIGFVTAYTINFIFADTGNWRAMFAIGLIPAILLAIGTWILPESPRWLISKNREHDAEKIINRFFATDKDMTVSNIRKTLIQTDEKIKALFSKALFPLLLTAILIFFFQSFTGINAVFYYAQTIFNTAGFGAKTGAMLASIGLGSANFFAACIGSKLVDIIGRRKLFFSGYLGIITSLILLGLIYHGLININNPMSSFILLFFYTFCFGISLGGIPYIIMAEIFPLKFRDSGMAFASSIGLWGSNIIVLLSFLSLTETLGMANVFWLYALISILGFLCCWRILPETNQISLETLELMGSGSFIKS
jgi:sugar porter (SP) family MFS transporter